MSMPEFPSVKPPITTDEALNMILTSIAMEELGLSHIINAEGEKLQYVLGTLHDNCGEKASIKEVLEVNKSIKGLLDSIMQSQMLLKNKMESAIDAMEIKKKCPTGPTGATEPVIFGNSHR